MSETKVAGIILAAGGSKRLGRPKQLLDWFGKPFIVQVIETAIDAGLDPVIVVTGANNTEIEAKIVDKKVLVKRNPNWENGQSSSMIAGIDALGENKDRPFIFMLCDQPQLPIELLEKLIFESKNEEIEIVTTSVNGKISPPVLFKPVCIPDLNLLTGDQGGRAVHAKHKTKIIEWGDRRLIMDSDTEADYNELVKAYSNQ